MSPADGVGILSESAARLGRERGRAEQARLGHHFGRTAVVPTCANCNAQFEGRTKRAKFCDWRCRFAYNRRQAIIARVLERPRCPMCGNPMPLYDRLGRRLVKPRTCSKRCSAQRYRWFGRMA